jgi:hypothetical protein
MRTFVIRLCLIACGFFGASASVDAACRKVGPLDSVRIDTGALQSLKAVGIDRAFIFQSLKDISVPETSGCWAGVTGNFDGQLVSAGVLQWNYGKDSLQPILKAYQRQFATRAALKSELDRLMPNHGVLIFSDGCLAVPQSADCVKAIKTLETNDEEHKLVKSLQDEFDALFESDSMIQVQVDRFVTFLGSVRDDLIRVFPNQVPSPRQIKWAIDTKVQQGSLPTDGDIARVRKAWLGLTQPIRQAKLLSLIKWYEGLSNAPDQDGTYKYETNAQIWSALIKDIAKPVSEEQMDLLQLTFLKSRTAQGEAGRWQANTFQRRAIVIFGKGCVAGQCF